MAAVAAPDTSMSTSDTPGRGDENANLKRRPGIANDPESDQLPFDGLSRHGRFGLCIGHGRGQADGRAARTRG